MHVLEVTMPQRSDSKEALQRWFHRVQNEFGQASGQAIMKSLIEECGGCRLSLPDMQDLSRAARDHRIRLLYSKGSTYEELSVNFDISTKHVRRIVHTKPSQRN